MCSISGFISNSPIDKNLAKRLSKALLFYGRERGEQSAGIYVNGVVTKQAVDPAVFVETDSFSKAFEGNDPIMVLCHTRQPTCGDRTDKQAQPFRQGEVTTIHNGCFFNIKGLKNEWNLKKTSGVDSELVTSFINQYGVQKLPEFIKSTDGPSAIAAIVNGELFIAKAGNPLVCTSLVFKGGQRLLVFASTKTILENALKYCLLVGRIKIKEPEDGGLFRVTPKRLKKICGGMRPNYGYGDFEFEGIWRKEYSSHHKGYFDDNDIYRGSEEEDEKDNEMYDTYDMVTRSWTDKKHKRIHEMTDLELEKEVTTINYPMVIKKYELKKLENKMVTCSGPDEELQNIWEEYEKLDKEIKEMGGYDKK